jgi:CheY-like chemotaxis protein
MKISYNMLWLDDKIDDFKDDGWVEKISQHLVEEGFEPNIVMVSKVEDFFLHLNDTFDLILTDFHMASKNGDEVVKDIREKNIQTEILFYTAKADLQAIGKIDRITFVETVNDHHSEVVEATKELINLTIKKFQHIIAMRGMIMHETSILDSQTTQILLSYINSKNVSCDEIVDSICSKLEEMLKKKKEFVVNVQSNKNFKKLIKDTFLFSASYKIEALKYILGNLSLFDFTDDYRKEVINLRNKFAHVILETDETGRQYFKSGEDGITFDESLCRTLRKDINKHKKNIDDLENKLRTFIGD